MKKLLVGFFFCVQAATLLSQPAPPGGGGTTNNFNFYSDDPPVTFPTNIILNWRTNLGLRSLITPAVGPDGTVYVQTDGGFSEAQLWAINPNMSTKWRADIKQGQQASDPVGGAVVVGTNDVILVRTILTNNSSSGQYHIAAYNSNGDRLWTNVLASNPNDPKGLAVGADGTIYFAASPWVYAISSNIVHWRYPSNNLINYQFLYSTPVVGNDGTIYLHEQTDGSLLALNPNGTVKWETSRLGVDWARGAPAIGADGTIFVGKGTNITAVKSDGTIKWVSYVSGKDFGLDSPVIAADGTLFIRSHYGTTTNVLIAINSTNGSVRWTRPMAPYQGGGFEGYKEASVAIVANGEIYVTDTDGMVYSFAPDGTTNWTYHTEVTDLRAPVIAADGSIYIVSYATDDLFSLRGASPPACSAWPQYQKNARHTAGPTPAPFLSSPSMQGNGFTFTVTGATNVPVCICASAGLVRWTNIGQITLTTGQTNFVDTQATNYHNRFYYAQPQ